MSCSLHAFETLEERRLLSAAVVDVAAGDLNGDGKADLAMLSHGVVHIAAGNGDGTFTPTTHSNLSLNFEKIRIGDFNGDGRADLAAVGIREQRGQTVGIIAILIGIKAGILSSPEYFSAVHHTIPLPHGTGTPVVGDWDGDGKDSVGFINEKQGFLAAVYQDLLSAQQTLRPGLVATTFGRGVRVAAGDVNGDGVADVVGLDRQGMTHVAFGVFSNNAISFQNPITFDSDGQADVRTDRILLGQADAAPGQEIFSFAGGDMYVSKLMEEEGIFFVKATGVTNVLPAVQRRAMITDVNGDGIGHLLALGKGKTLYNPASGAFF